MRSFIDDALRDPDAAVYIHCFAGVNRSGALAVAYACDTLNLPATEVVHRVRRGTNRLILTNDGFMSQLVERFG
jgi:protein-tyrosine phosphatase